MFVLQKYMLIRRKLAQTLAQAKNKKMGIFFNKKKLPKIGSSKTKESVLIR